MDARAGEFDIYQTDAGYAAVTNPVRRKILEALAERERELPDFVRLTAKSKSTLSNLHVKELLQQGLVEERPHPTDARRKIYRLKGRRIGSSDVPIDQLRGAVKHYVSLSPLAHTIPLPAVVGILVAGARAASAEALRAQGRALGRTAAPLFTTTGPRDALTAIAGFWEREALARAGRIDLDRLELEVEVAEGYVAEEKGLEGVGAVLGGFLEGVLGARLAIEGAVAVKTRGERRVILALPKA